VVSVRTLLGFGWIAPKLGALALVAWRRRRRAQARRVDLSSSLDRPDHFGKDGLR
jgi:hypothetical protein